MGQYEFPNPEWADVSQEGEETYTQDLFITVINIHPG